MLREIIISGLLAGLIAGAAAAGLQHFTTTPLILAAETYEKADGAAESGSAGHSRGTESGETAGHHHGSGHDHGAGGAWMPADGLERTAATSVATTLAGVGFALILTALMALSGRAVDGRTGLLWGLAGFAAATLAPSVGLAPELPGSAAAALEARQLWWVATVVATGAGLWLLAFREGLFMRLVALVLILAPHAVGAPQPEGASGAVPPELAARFATTSIAVAGIFWVLVGLLAGHFLGRSAAARPG